MRVLVKLPAQPAGIVLTMLDLPQHAHTFLMCLPYIGSIVDMSVRATARPRAKPLTVRLRHTTDTTERERSGVY